MRPALKPPGKTPTASPKTNRISEIHNGLTCICRQGSPSGQLKSHLQPPFPKRTNLLKNQPPQLHASRHNISAPQHLTSRVAPQSTPDIAGANTSQDLKHKRKATAPWLGTHTAGETWPHRWKTAPELHRQKSCKKLPLSHPP